MYITMLTGKPFTGCAAVEALKLPAKEEKKRLLSLYRKFYISKALVTCSLGKSTKSWAVTQMKQPVGLSYANTNPAKRILHK